MKNYYILSVDSFQDTFTRIDAGKDFYFELSVQNISGILSVCRAEILLLFIERVRCLDALLFFKL